MVSRPFRFGFSLDGLDEPREIARRVRRAEDIGYSSVVMTDHFDDRHGPLVALTAIALATTSLRVGTLVLANDYRHPAVLAKELASLDQVSDGRLEIGIGAGWMASDYEQAGIGFDRPGVRIERLDEAISVLEGCFSDGPFDLEGSHYTIRGLDSRPKPVQKPRPPLLVAGGGHRMLALAARRADIVGINPSLHSGAIDEHAGPTATAEATDSKLAVVRDAAGDRFDALELQTRVHLAVITDDAPPWPRPRRLPSESPPNRPWPRPTHSWAPSTSALPTSRAGGRAGASPTSPSWAAPPRRWPRWSSAWPVGSGGPVSGR